MARPLQGQEPHPLLAVPRLEVQPYQGNLDMVVRPPKSRSPRCPRPCTSSRTRSESFGVFNVSVFFPPDLIHAWRRLKEKKKPEKEKKIYIFSLVSKKYKTVLERFFAFSKKKKEKERGKDKAYNLMKSNHCGQKYQTDVEGPFALPVRRRTSQPPRTWQTGAAQPQS